MTAHVHDAYSVLDLVLIIAAVLAICGGLYRAWVRDFVTAAVLIIAGLIVLAFAT